VTADVRIRVLIVDDSVVVRGSLGRIIDAETDMRVVTTAVHGQDALDALRHTAADVVLLDLEMPVMDGLAALPRILECAPETRVVMISSLTHEGASITMRALALGAVDFIHKPQAKEGVQGLQMLADQLVAKVRAVGRGRVGHRAIDRGHDHDIAAGIAESRATQDTGGDVRGARASDRAVRETATPFASRVTSSVMTPPRAYPPPSEPRLLAIAASTGGPNALAELVRVLPVDFPLPILVTQHMPPIFTHMLAQRLSREGVLACDEARDGDVVMAGRIYIAPGDRHLIVTRSADAPVIRLVHGEPENHCRPSADPMFRSVAQVYGAGGIAMVLTGMGDDGRRGCEAVAAMGGRVLVQDEASSVVWGMPGSVVDAGVPCIVLPLSGLVSHVTSLCSTRA